MSTLHAVMAPYIEKIERQIDLLLKEFVPANDLSKAIAYCLTQKGKRLRPVITLMVAEALGKNSVIDSALSLELFHTASLLADDLPCMDDAESRRGDVATHIMFNEATALLASYSLIAKGYELISKNATLLPQEDGHQVLLLALQSASHNTGFDGASGGQYLDLYAKQIDGALLDEVMRKKTAALFESAFLFGWLFAGKMDQLAEVKRLGMNFGFAFQLVDDLLDYEEDLSAERKINYAIFYGPQETIRRVREIISLCKADLTALHLDTKPLLAILYYLESKIESL